jgi:uncharacterized protein YegJ (DUF2314 family)
MTRTVGYAPLVTVLGLGLIISGCEKKQAQAAVNAAEQAKAKAAEGQATARQRWPEFLEAFSKATDHSTFKVKAAIPAKSGEVDAWINVQSVVGTSVAGPLLEAPAGTDHKKGDRVTVTPDKVKDWAYTLNGKTVGDFTAPPAPATPPTPPVKK